MRINLRNNKPAMIAVVSFFILIAIIMSGTVLISYFANEKYFMENRENFIETEIKVVDFDKKTSTTGTGSDRHTETTYTYYIEYKINGEIIHDRFSSSIREYESGDTYTELVDKTNPSVRHKLVGENYSPVSGGIIFFIVFMLAWIGFMTFILIQTIKTPSNRDVRREW